MQASIIPEGTSLTFADYFKLNAYIEDILASFGYSYRSESCKLPHKEIAPEHLAGVRLQLEEMLPHVSLRNETARREFLIAPLLTEAVRRTGASLRVEHPLEVEERLKGTLDYYLRAAHNLLVVEAEQGDLQKGFNQLAVELVALDRWADDIPEPRIYGALSTGDVWKFGYVDRAEKRIVEDFNTYGVPMLLEDIIRILVALLSD